jgi:hypothetical protein
MGSKSRNKRRFHDPENNCREHSRPRKAQNPDRRNRRPPRWAVAVLLESGKSFEGNAVIFNNPQMPKCKVFFKSGGGRDFGIDADINTRASAEEVAAAVQSIVNNYLLQLHKEARLEFPEWLEKFSSRSEESNPFFNLDEIREEFNYRKTRFGAWRGAAQAGFFTDIKPQSAEFDRIVHLELREPAAESYAKSNKE